MMDDDPFEALRVQDDIDIEPGSRDPLPALDVVKHVHTPLYEDGPAAPGLVWLSGLSGGGSSDCCCACTEFGRRRDQTSALGPRVGGTVGPSSLKEMAARVIDQHMDFATPTSAAVWAATRDVEWMRQVLMEERWRAVGVVGRHPSRLYVQPSTNNVMRIDCANNTEFWLVVDVQRLCVKAGRVPDFEPRVCPDKHRAMMWQFWDSHEREEEKKAWNQELERVRGRQVATYRRGLAGYSVAWVADKKKCRITYDLQPDFFVEVFEIDVPA